MRVSPTRSAIAVWLCCNTAAFSGCRGEVHDAPPRAGQDSSPATVPVRCRSGADASGQQRPIALARQTYEWLRGGDLEAVWKRVHPALRVEARKKPFLAALENLRGQLESVAVSRLEVSDVRLIHVAPGVQDSLRIRCPASQGNGGDEATVVAQVDGDDLLFLELDLGGTPLARGLAFKWRAHGPDWGLVDVRVRPKTFRGQDARHYAAHGERLRQSGDLLAAYFAYGIAQTLVNSGQGLEVAFKSEVADPLQRIGSDPSFSAQTDRWTIAGKDYELIRVGLHALDETLLPAISYVTSLPLDATDAIRSEATLLARHLQSEFPTVAQMLDGVVFEAYADRPTSPGRAYDAARVIIFFGDGADGSAGLGPT